MQRADGRPASTHVSLTWEMLCSRQIGGACALMPGMGNGLSVSVMTLAMTQKLP